MRNLSSKFAKKKILIYGFAKSGLATLKFLKKIKSEIYCWDDNSFVRKCIKKKYLLNFKEKLTNNFILTKPKNYGKQRFNNTNLYVIKFILIKINNIIT